MVRQTTFSDSAPDSIVQPCDRAKKMKAKPAPWDVKCACKILCPKNKPVVEQLAKSTVETANEVWFEDPYFDGATWTTKRFDAGGSADPGTKSIMVLADQGCEGAAITFYHEVWHQNQPAGMGWPEPAEDDAYYNTELWTIKHGLPSQGKGLRMKDPKTGKIVPNKKAIRKMVQHQYPSPPPPVAGVKQPVPIGQRNGVLGPETEVQDPATGAIGWRPSKKGDTYAGPQKISGYKKIDPAEWSCP
jgi:hypothetical protein